MIILFFLFVLVFIAMVSNAKDEAKQNQEAFVREFKKVCTPHKWRYDEIKNHEGVTQTWKMTCEHCGPLRPLDVPQKTDY